MVDNHASAHDRSVLNNVRKIAKKRGKHQDLDLHLDSPATVQVTLCIAVKKKDNKMHSTFIVPGPSAHLK